MNDSVELASFVAQYSGLDEEAFVAKHPHPFLLIQQAEPGKTDSQKAQFQTTAVSLSEEQAQPGDAQAISVWPVQHGQGATFVVTLGRAKTNDIFLDNASISKMHAFFHHDILTGTYTVSDAGSRNGTSLNEQRLAPEVATALKDGDVLAFAGRYVAVFLSNRALFQRCAAQRR